MRWWFLLAALMPAAAGATTIQFADLCPGAARVQRSTTDPMKVEVWCVGESQPRLTLGNCPAPARITTKGNDKIIECPGGGWPVVVRQK